MNSLNKRGKSYKKESCQCTFCELGHYQIETILRDENGFAA